VTVAELVHHAERELHRALLASEHGRHDEARAILVGLFYEIDYFLCPEPRDEIGARP
jgi:hypothetical protein